MGALSPSLRSWIVPGLAGTLAVVDADGAPQIARIWAVRAAEDGDVLEIYIQGASARGVVAALECPRRAALNLIEIPSYRSRSFKGVCERSLREPESAIIDTWLTAFSRVFSNVGLPPDAPQRMLSHGDDPTMLVLRLTVDSVFDQSPKPGAGARL